MMKDLFIGRCIKDQFVILEMSVEKKHMDIQALTPGPFDRQVPYFQARTI